MSNKPTDPQDLLQPDNPASEPPEIDAHGHNPTDYDWVPVLRKRRKDGWTPQEQRQFIEALADSGVVIDAARAVGMSDTAAYGLRRAPGAEGSAAAWDAALCAAMPPPLPHAPALGVSSPLRSYATVKASPKACITPDRRSFSKRASADLMATRRVLPHRMR